MCECGTCGSTRIESTDLGPVIPWSHEMPAEGGASWRCIICGAVAWSESVETYPREDAWDFDTPIDADAAARAEARYPRCREFHAHELDNPLSPMPEGVAAW